MNNSTDPRFPVYGGVGSRCSDPVRLCCALTSLFHALAMCVPKTERGVAITPGVCDCRGFRTEEIGWRSVDEAS
jgi:hypothetical protein